MIYDKIPIELKILKSWVVWRYEDIDSKKPTKIPYCPATGRRASVTDPNTWETFDNVVPYLKDDIYSGVGFVLSDNDPYTFIDLDDSANPNNWERQGKIADHFDSYSEQSPSGNGLHIIVRGSVPSGRKRSAVEIYSNLRYMTMTGDVFRDKPINDYNDDINVLWSEMGAPVDNQNYYAGLEEAENDDEKIIEIATNATNGDLFSRLWAGDWSDYEPNATNTHSSEADFALIDILAFYSKNKAQITRLFRQSGLGKRKKAQRDDYLGYMLNRCFDRMLPPIDIDGLNNRLTELIEKRKTAEIEKAREIIYNKPVETESVLNEVTTENSIYDPPPGLLGDIAKFIYNQSPRPVGEIALAGAIGCMAGIVGRSYNVEGGGLNQYTILIGKTGCGKSAMRRGITALFNAIKHDLPNASDFRGPDKIASQQAIVKFMANGRTSFVSIMGEFGHDLQMMCGRNPPTHLMGVKQFLLASYELSGHGSVMEPTIYSDKDKNTQCVDSPAFSLLAESTPKMYEDLNEGLIADGFLPRFTMIDYHGPRVPKNKEHHKVKPTKDLLDQFQNICAYSLSLNSENKCVEVDLTDNAAIMSDQLADWCDKKINEANNSDHDVLSQIWNRVDFKVLKLAALVAIGINPLNPVITTDNLDWASRIIIANADTFTKKFKRGEIGIDNDENKQMGKVISVIEKYIVSDFDKVAKYCGGESKLHSDRIIPYSFIQRKLASVAIFRNDRLGSSSAIKRTLTTLMERGDIQELSKAVTGRDYNTSARCFVVKNPRAFGLD